MWKVIISNVDLAPVAVLSSVLTSLPLQLSHFGGTCHHVWLARNEGKGSGGCQWPLDHCPCAGVGAAVTGMALEALHFGLTHLGYGLPAPQLVKMKGTFSGTGKVAASLDVVFYYEVLLCSCVLINTHTHIKPSLTVLQ